MGPEKGDRRRWELICRFEREVREDLMYGEKVDDRGCVYCARLIGVGHVDRNQLKQMKCTVILVMSFDSKRDQVASS